MKINELGSMVDKLLTEEIKKYIMEDMGNKKVYHIKCDGEPIDTFENEDDARDELPNYEKNHPGKQIILEPGVYESYEDMIEKLDKMGEIKDMKKNKLKESKKSILVTETQMKTIIKNLVNENIPGIEVTKKAQAQSKKDADANLKDVETKMNKAAKFDGNDKPEFPKQIGGDKMAFYNTEKEEEYVEDYRGGGMQDVEPDEDPGENWKKRKLMSLKGDKLMGNSQDAANVVKSDLGEKLASNAERKAKKVAKDPMYIKDPQPVKEVSTTKINEDIQRMKEMYSYNKSTQ